MLEEMGLNSYVGARVERSRARNGRFRVYQLQQHPKEKTTCRILQETWKVNKMSRFVNQAYA